MVKLLSEGYRGHFEMRVRTAFFPSKRLRNAGLPVPSIPWQNHFPLDSWLNLRYT